jgi:hypothetical protein
MQVQLALKQTRAATLPFLKELILVHFEAPGSLYLEIGLSWRF